MRGPPRAVFLVLVTVLAAGVGSVPAAASPGGTVDVIVTFENADAVDRTAVTAVGGTVTGGGSVDVVPALFARVPEGAMDELAARPGVASVTRDGERSMAGQTVPWGINRTEARKAASRVNATAQSDVQVAVLDTGIDHDHLDLGANVAWGVNTVGSGAIQNGTTAADDNNGHGTHVAGTVAALDNDIGVVGVAPSVTIYSIKVLDSDGIGADSDIIEGVDEAMAGPDGTRGTADDADVLSLSLGGDSPSAGLETALENASEDAIIVASAGNSGDGDPTTNNVSYPAKYDDVIAVAATNRSDLTTGFSSEGAEVELAAPGDGIRSTYLNDTLADLSGTSQAAPHVAGTAALLMAEDAADGTRNFTNAEFRDALGRTALDIGPAGRDNFSGFGRLQADAVVGGTTVQLGLSANATAVEVGDTVGFSVTRNDTGGAANATVTVNGTALQTGSDGQVAYTVDQAGDVTATATKQATVIETFRSDSVTVSVTNTSTVSSVDVNGDGNNATDPDGDGLFEDVNGDGGFDIADVQALFVNRKSSAVTDNPSLFDFNGDGSFTISDVQFLFVNRDSIVG